MSFKEAISYFKNLVVCRTQINWTEVRLSGKFIRVQDMDNLLHEVTLSKWYYSCEIVGRPRRVFVSLHQEDERIRGVLLKRPYMDISLAVLRVTPGHDIELVDLRDFVLERQLEIEVNLEPGSYIFLPRTSGCTAF